MLAVGLAAHYGIWVRIAYVVPGSTAIWQASGPTVTCPGLLA